MLRRMFVSGLALAATALAAAPVTTTDFVQVAVAQERAVERCTGHVQIEHAVELDRAGLGKPGQDLTIVRRFSGLAPNEKMVIVSARKGGKDAQAEFQAASKRSQADQYRSPFHPDTRPLYSFFRVDGPPADHVQLSFKPSYTHRGDRGLFEGVADFDRATGRLLGWRGQLVNPPTFVTHAEVRVSYAAQVGTLAAPSSVDVDLEGGVLFYKRQGRMHFQLAEYTCPESMPRPAGPVVSEPAAPITAPSGARAERGS